MPVGLFNPEIRAVFTVALGGVFADRASAHGSDLVRDETWCSPTRLWAKQGPKAPITLLVSYSNGENSFACGWRSSAFSVQLSMQVSYQ